MNLLEIPIGRMRYFILWLFVWIIPILWLFVWTLIPDNNFLLFLLSFSVVAFSVMSYLVYCRILDINRSYTWVAYIYFLISLVSLLPSFLEQGILWSNLWLSSLGISSLWSIGSVVTNVIYFILIFIPWGNYRPWNISAWIQSPLNNLLSPPPVNSPSPPKISDFQLSNSPSTIENKKLIVEKLLVPPHPHHYIVQISIVIIACVGLLIWGILYFLSWSQKDTVPPTPKDSVGPFGQTNIPEPKTISKNDSTLYMGHEIPSQINIPASDTIPKDPHWKILAAVSFRPGKVAQHFDLQSQSRKTDEDWVSWAILASDQNWILSYCRKFYPNTRSIMQIDYAVIHDRKAAWNAWSYVARMPARWCVWQ